MDLRDAFMYSLKKLGTRSLRSWLTILGMVIGVMAIVMILAITEGFNKDVTDQLDAFGPDQMFVYPVSDIGESLETSPGGFAVAQTSGKILQEDFDDIIDIPGVKDAARTIYGRASLSFKGKNITAFVIGVDTEIFEMYDHYIEIESGRVFKENEERVVFFAADAATEYFGKDEIQVAHVVQINEKNFRTVGIQKRLGTSLSAQDDSAVYVPFDDARDLFKGQLLKNEVGFVLVQIDEGYNPENIKDSIERKLAANHGVRLDELDFSVITSAQITDIVGTVLLSIQVVLGAITLIASVVGAIGIANTMFMDVLERIHEIGILKSVGATEADILVLFLVEASIIGIAGGTIGLALAILGLNIIETAFDIPVLLTPAIVFFVFIFSIGTGMLAGFLPALRAAKLDVVEALGYI
jgi:putative ABC transport system permease protein